MKCLVSAVVSDVNAPAYIFEPACAIKAVRFVNIVH
jgi:hypothetical protein